MPFISNIRDAFASKESADRGVLIERVLLIAGFAIVAILAVTWIGNAIAGDAANLAHCVSGANQANERRANDLCRIDIVGTGPAVSSQIADGKDGRF